MLKLSTCAVDLQTGIVQRDRGTSTSLTERERDLLAFLEARSDRAVSRAELLAEIWGRSGSSRACDNAIRRLRAKIEADPSQPEHIVTVHGVGYRFVLATSPPLPVPDRPAQATRWVDLGSVQLDFGRHLARGPRGEVHLSAQEVALLRRLWQARGAAVDRTTLLREVWGQRAASRAVDHAVRRLRAKLEADPAHPSWVLSERGVGYRLAVGRPARVVDAGGSFVGRADDLQRVRDAPARWVLITGPGGMGKTRLARRVASELPGRAWWVECAASRSEADLACAVAEALGASPDPTHAVGHVGRVLSQRGTGTVVLDNLEQAVDAARSCLAAWSGAAPELRFLGTSRRPLGLPGEVVVDLRPLSAAEATDLFVARARAAGATLDPQVDAATLAALMGRLDGIPLAVELAAARAPVLSPSALLARIDRRLDLLKRPRGAVARHRTLRATLEGSWELLTAEEAGALEILSLFRGPFDAGDARGLLGPAGPELLRAVRQHSLLFSKDAETFGVAEVVRDFAAERRASHPDGGTAMEARWVRWLARLGRQDHLAGLQRDPAARAAQLAAIPDLEAATTLAADPSDRLSCAVGAAWGRMRTGPFSVAVDGLTGALEGAPPSVTASQAHSLLTACLRQDDRPRDALEVAEGGLAVCEDDLLTAQLLAQRATALADLGRYDEAAEAYDQAPAAYERAGRADLAAWTRSRAAFFRGDDEQALAASEACLLAAQRLGQVGVEALARLSLGRSAAAKGQWDAARDRFAEAADAFGALGRVSQQISALSAQADVLLHLGDHEEVERVTSRILGLARDEGSAVSVAMTLRQQVASRAVRGDLQGAHDALAAAGAVLATTRPLPRLQNKLDIRAAQLALAAGQPRAAERLAAEVLERNGASGDTVVGVRARCTLAHALLADARPDEAWLAAEAAVGQARDASPQVRGLALVCRGLAAQATGRTEQARRDLETTAALALSPESETGLARARLVRTLTGATTGPGCR